MAESKSAALPLGYAPTGSSGSGRTPCPENPVRCRGSTEGDRPFQLPKRRIFHRGRLRAGRFRGKDLEKSPFSASEATPMTYRAPISDMLLALNHGAGLQA